MNKAQVAAIARKIIGHEIGLKQRGGRRLWVSTIDEIGRRIGVESEEINRFFKEVNNPGEDEWKEGIAVKLLKEQMGQANFKKEQFFEPVSLGEAQLTQQEVEEAFLFLESEDK